MDERTDIIKKAADTIRFLSADAVEKAASGHPGMPMGAADYSIVLWAAHMVFNPEDPAWTNRDRFILSAGHGSMLLYSLLHMFGFDLSMEDIKSFRQWKSNTPGHPERGVTPGVETTTGPLGQGFANGVGMALASKILASRVNTPSFPIISHRVFGVVSDGDIMEGVAAEAASIAGHLGLGNIVYIYDDNDITIEGPRGLAFSEETARRFEACGWHVLEVFGHDHQAVNAAITLACAETRRPSLVMAKTKIAYGCPNKVGLAETHGAPVGPDEVKEAKKCSGWQEPEFTVPQDVYDLCRKSVEQKLEAYRYWHNMLSEFREKEPERAGMFDAFKKGEVPGDIQEKALEAIESKPGATRKSFGTILQVLSREVPFLYGGSADLGDSNKTVIKDQPSIAKGEFKGRNLHFGIREHAMAAISNGMAIYGFIPYAGTFLVFSDYMRPAIRMAALMGLRVLFVFTHDSIYVGEDGPTHQPIEQIAALRAMPGLDVIRPADSAETAVACCAALKRDGPTALLLSRQTVPLIDREKYAPESGAKKGAYVLAGSDHGKAPDIIIMATGSEVGLGLEVHEDLSSRGVDARLLSMPCLEQFEREDEEYRQKVLPEDCTRRVVLEAGSSFGWHKYCGDEGLLVCMDSFGSSAPYKVLAEKFGFTKQGVIERIEQAFPELEKG